MTIEVEVVCDSVSTDSGSRCSTLVLRYPRAIHSEFMTHRKFGRNASSSRAIPMSKMHTSIQEDPAYPEKWTLDEPGMQGYQEADETTINLAKAAIEYHREKSIEIAEYLASLGLHKQIVNRYTEAHQHIRVVVTSSDWQNFLLLRTHETAEPTMQVLATAIGDALSTSRPSSLDRGDWHLPYFDQEEFDGALFGTSDLQAAAEHFLPTQFMKVFPPYGGNRSIKRLLSIAISAARCARVSYNNFEGRRSGIEEDLTLFGKLIVAQPIHASPLEHQATPDWLMNGHWIPQRPNHINPWANPHQHGNLVGWRQARKFIPGEDGRNWGE